MENAGASNHTMGNGVGREHELCAGLLGLIVAIIDAVDERRLGHARNLGGPAQEGVLRIVDDSQGHIGSDGLDIHPIPERRINKNARIYSMSKL